MNIWESVRLALKAILSHKLRSILTTTGVMIGVMTVIGMLALIDGLNRKITNQLSSIGTNIFYVQKRGWILSREEMQAARGRKNLTLEDAEAVSQQVQSAQRVAPMLSGMATVRYSGEVLDGVEIVGTTPEYQYITEFKIESGRQLTSTDLNQTRQVSLIGKTVAEELFGSVDPVGNSILIGQNRFEVIAVLQPKGELFGNDQDNIIIIPISAYIKFISGPVSIRGRESVTIIVEPKSPEHIEKTRQEIVSLLRRRRNVRPSDENDFSINTAEQLLETYRNITSGVFALMIGVTVLSLVVGGIGIMNIMLVSVSERTREIGIRRAVGAKRRDILRQFLIEAIVLSCVGGVIGMFLGFVLAWLVSQVVNLPATVSWWSIFLGFGFSVLVGIFFGWYPASRAASMDLVESLHYE
ncbi:MAG: FtsX-like permease family protein [Fibrobacter sp.]|jgi:putative ABC transport system permease protein|nr:FtsX-like permease family protein [Fibrobacter sp.]